MAQTWLGTDLALQRSIISARQTSCRSVRQKVDGSVRDGLVTPEDCISAPELEITSRAFQQKVLAIALLCVVCVIRLSLRSCHMPPVRRVSVRAAA